MHIDMDAFYASVEQHDNPSLKGLPVIIGGGVRGVVSAASYEARTYGVRSAMPMFRARALCPNGVFLHGCMARYVEVSREIMAVLQRFSPVVEKASVDEAYLDATGLHRVFGPVENMACEIKKTVRAETGLACSVGLAPVKFLAKIASDLNKPDGLAIIYPADVPAFLATLPIGKIPGVGKKTLPELERLGVKFAAEISRYPRDFWIRRFGKMGGILFERAEGRDERDVTPYEPPKSESAENTFEEDTTDREFLVTWLLRQSERVGRSLRKQHLAGRTVTLKVKYADFTTVTRARTLPQRTCVTRLIFDTAVSLLEELAPKEKIRLIGVGVSHFEEEGKSALPQARQLSLFGSSENALREPVGQADSLSRERAMDAVMDAVREKFGANMVMRGRLLEQEAAHSGQEAATPPESLKKALLQRRSAK